MLLFLLNLHTLVNSINFDIFQMHNFSPNTSNKGSKWLLHTWKFIGLLSQCVQNWIYLLSQICEKPQVCRLIQCTKVSIHLPMLASKTSPLHLSDHPIFSHIMLKTKFCINLVLSTSTIRSSFQITIISLLSTFATTLQPLSQRLIIFLHSYRKSVSFFPKNTHTWKCHLPN